MSDIDLGDLEELIGCKGWAWLTDQARREFGPEALIEKLRQIAARADESAELRQAKTEQAFVSQRAILGLLEMPSREIAKQREAAHASRVDEFAGVRHRGGTL